MSGASGATVRYRFPMGERRAVARRDHPKGVAGPRRPLLRRDSLRTARMLALAYHVERLVEDGELSGYADAARRLGLTRARMTQVMNLLRLAPAIQEQALAGELRVNERTLRRAVGKAEWEVQVACVTTVASTDDLDEH